MNVVDNKDGTISLGSAAGKTNFTSSHGDLTFEKNGNDVDVNLTNIYTKDKFKTNEILSDYENLTATEANNKALAKALDVKAVRDELKTVAINTQTSLDTRVPSAPRHTGCCPAWTPEAGQRSCRHPSTAPGCSRSESPSVPRHHRLTV